MTTSAEAIGLGDLGERAESGLRGKAAVRLLAAALQLGLAVLVIRAFRIEGPNFTRLALLVLGGFVVHAVLPMAWRVPFFLALSVAGTLLFMGPAAGLWIVGLGTVLLFIATLRIRLAARVAILLAAAAALGVLRSGAVPAGIPGAVWPILASMFMFRLAIYLYDIQHGVEKGPPARALAYFFMIPNVAFPLFPVVDYKTFVRNYYDQEDWRIYQRGLRWIARGLLHLVIYRLLYHHLTLDLAEVRSGPQLVQYIFVSFMLYLRVSGMYHLAVGMLHLFGFRLPETNHFWLFCQSFTDLWRRMNIYFRDFMMKLVYYPSFFRVRKLGVRKGIALALVVVFFMTWALHVVQWFWLRNDLLFTWQDISFYIFLGSLVIWQTLKESAPGRKRTLAASQGFWSLRRGINALLTMGTLMILWSYWTADSLGEWFAMWPDAVHWPAAATGVIVACLVAFLLLGGFSWKSPELAERKEDGMLRSGLLTSGTLGGLLLLGQPGLVERVSPRAETLLKPVQENQLNRRDNETLLRGYYEKVDSKGQLASQVIDLEQEKPADWERITATAVYRERPDFLGGELIPSTQIRFKNADFLTNRWGLHDQDYEQKPTEGTFRVVLLGPSDVMGEGVATDRTFEALVESQLNRERLDPDHRKYEILNFGVAAFSMMQQAALLEQRAMEFEPDLVIMSYHPHVEGPNATRYLVDVVRAGRSIPYPDLQAIVTAAGIDSSTKSAAAMRRMMPKSPQLLEWSVRRVAEICRERGIPFVLLIMDSITQPSPADQPLITYARSLGYTIADLRGVYEGHEPTTLVLAQWDRHPNQAGHQLLAEALYQRLIAAGDSVGLAPR